MRILVIGSGAREHALLRGLARDPAVRELHIAPGNAGTVDLATSHPVAVGDAAAITALAVSLEADLVVIGPEVPLVAGAVDALQTAGIPGFGPTAAAAAIEGSKAFAKDVMAAAGVPTGRSISLAPDVPAEAVDRALDEFGAPYVVKDDGLAAGKGVVVTTDRDAAATHAREVLAAGHPALVEEYLAGPEVSLFAVCDGSRCVPLLPAQDFKRVGDGDTGPNTGGMGAYAPLPWIADDLVDTVQRTVLEPVLAEMTRRGTPFAGLLYAGLVITEQGPKVIEFNCRFGDPETQVVLELLDSSLAQLLLAAALGDLTGLAPQWKSGSAVTVVVAAQNYPGTPTGGDEITGIAAPTADAVVLHAGTALDAAGQLVSAGGRVLSATAHGADLATARAQAYRLAEAISLRGSHFRRDIALTAELGTVQGAG